MSRSLSINQSADAPSALPSQNPPLAANTRPIRSVRHRSGLAQLSFGDPDVESSSESDLVGTKRGRPKRHVSSQGEEFTRELPRFFAQPGVAAFADLVYGKGKGQHGHRLVLVEGCLYRAIYGISHLRFAAAFLGGRTRKTSLEHITARISHNQLQSQFAQLVEQIRSWAASSQAKAFIGVQTPPHLQAPPPRVFLDLDQPEPQPAVPAPAAPAAASHGQRPIGAPPADHRSSGSPNQSSGNSPQAPPIRIPVSMLLNDPTECAALDAPEVKPKSPVPNRQWHALVDFVAEASPLHAPEPARPIRLLSGPRSDPSAADSSPSPNPSEAVDPDFVLLDEGRPFSDDGPSSGDDHSDYESGRRRQQRKRPRLSNSARQPPRPPTDLSAEEPEGSESSSGDSDPAANPAMQSRRGPGRPRGLVGRPQSAESHRKRALKHQKQLERVKLQPRLFGHPAVVAFSDLMYGSGKGSLAHRPLLIEGRLFRVIHGISHNLFAAAFLGGITRKTSLEHVSTRIHHKNLAQPFDELVALIRAWLRTPDAASQVGAEPPAAMLPPPVRAVWRP
eukprot:TRINITY_DN11093_c0_g1_i1.p1 TRINITY_DN11093_c0_g1~~TRINITY_DN11093_c0_g1_i1.p1  ORF type:complete len:562 (+),score=44.04 TRINITY_DN11093_c0_g1_i1:97-1782(+)